MTFSFPASSHCGPNGEHRCVQNAPRSRSFGRIAQVSFRISWNSRAPVTFNWTTVPWNSFSLFFSSRLFKWKVVFADGDRWIEDVSREPKIGLRYFSLRGSFISSKDFKVLLCCVSGLLETYWIYNWKKKKWREFLLLLLFKMYLVELLTFNTNGYIIRTLWINASYKEKYLYSRKKWDRNDSDFLICWLLLLRISPFYVNFFARARYVRIIFNLSTSKNKTSVFVHCKSFLN